MVTRRNFTKLSLMAAAGALAGAGAEGQRLDGKPTEVEVDGHAYRVVLRPNEIIVGEGGTTPGATSDFRFGPDKWESIMHAEAAGATPRNGPANGHSQTFRRDLNIYNVLAGGRYEKQSNYEPAAADNPAPLDLWKATATHRKAAAAAIQKQMAQNPNFAMPKQYDSLLHGELASGGIQPPTADLSNQPAPQPARSNAGLPPEPVVTFDKNNPNSVHIQLKDWTVDLTKDPNRGNGWTAVATSEKGEHATMVYSSGIQGLKDKLRPSETTGLTSLGSWGVNFNGADGKPVLFRDTAGDYSKTFETGLAAKNTPPSHQQPIPDQLKGAVHAVNLAIGAAARSANSQGLMWTPPNRDALNDPDRVQTTAPNKVFKPLRHMP